MLFERLKKKGSSLLVGFPQSTATVRAEDHSAVQGRHKNCHNLQPPTVWTVTQRALDSELSIGQTVPSVGPARKKFQDGSRNK